MLPGLSTFVGREAESARLAELVARHRMVSVVGPGGMGKTRLTSELLAAPPAGFEAGPRRCELAALAARDDVGREVAGALGFASLEALVLGLGDARSLLLLDNCEHLLAAVARLCERLLAEVPSLHLVVTSRERLGIEGEEVLVLGSLASTAAARLFEDRARSAGAKLADTPSELAARAELCRRLDGVPLAIELAAARARALSATETLALLGRRFDLLQRPGPLGLARHKSLRAAIDASYELLAPAEQAFFRALGVFAGPFTAPLAHAVAAAEGADLLATVDALSRLVDRSLVGADPAGGTTRYGLLESLRDYAAEQSRAAGEWAAHTDRFVDAMVGEAVRIVTAGSVRWSSELLASVLLLFDGLVAALERTLETDADATRAFRLLLPLWGATHQGRASEVAEIAERVLARWPLGREPLRAEATAVAASALLASGRVEAATGRAHAVSEDPAATPLARVLALRTLGIVAHQGGDAAAARDAALRASRLARENGLPALARELRVFAASTAQGEDALAPALAELAEVAAAAAGESDPIGVVWAKVVATHLLVRAGRLGEARRELAIAREAQEGFEYPYGAKVTLRLAATLAALERGFADARASWLAAIERCAASGDLAELALALRTAAALAARAGDAAASAALLDAVPPGVRPVILGVLFEHPDEAALRARELATPEPGRNAAALRRVRELLAQAGPAPAQLEPAPVRSGALLRQGELWTLRFAGRTAQLPHRKGLEDLAALLARPEQEVHCLELIGGGDVGGDAGPALDSRARAEYQARIRELQSECDEARDANDLGRAERAEAELDALVSQLSEAFGLGGRRRATGSAAERARSAVAWRIRSALKQVEAHHPELGRHLKHAVRTGAWCSYRPEAPVAWEVEAGGPR
jgi:predicted ATPase